MRRSLLGLALVSGLAAAQLTPPNPDWKELDAPAPPALRTERLISIDMPGSSLRFAVDPASVSLGADGIVRYVVVARSSTGTVNGIYEGLRCSTSEVKVYARHNPDAGWVPATGAEWQNLQTARNGRHSLQIARTGACMGNAPNRHAEQIVRDLRAGPEQRFSN